jgi:two-component system chemotaxis response regulator CheY
MAKPKVLIVDDDNLMRTLLKAILRDEGYIVVGEAKDGASGIEACERFAPELVCLDIIMPGMGGLEALKTIRERHPDINVVMITADSTMATVREAVSSGASGYLIKPFTPKRVADALKSALAGPAGNDFG